MPGAGGPGPMAPPGPPGAGGGDDAGGGKILQLLAGLQQAPSPSAEERMIFEATVMVNGAYARVAVRNAKVGKLLMDANSKLNQALEAMKGESTRPMGAPPDMGMSTPQPAPAGPNSAGGF